MTTRPHELEPHPQAPQEDPDVQLDFTQQLRDGPEAAQPPETETPDTAEAPPPPPDPDTLVTPAATAETPTKPELTPEDSAKIARYQQERKDFFEKFKPKSRKAKVGAAIGALLAGVGGVAAYFGLTGGGEEEPWPPAAAAVEPGPGQEADPEANFTAEPKPDKEISQGNESVYQEVLSARQAEPILLTSDDPEQLVQDTYQNIANVTNGQRFDLLQYFALGDSTIESEIRSDARFAAEEMHVGNEEAATGTYEFRIDKIIDSRLDKDGMKVVEFVISDSFGGDFARTQREELTFYKSPVDKPDGSGKVNAWVASQRIRKNIDYNSQL